ncbi:hypothetical protein AYL99_00796 [Fonsecaea erecta]|uniref:GPI anchored protein n=1 Tax=Fonsecaea erecta TaxID=1367422 RepID=A0A178ZYB2_9EURO|nr:hypothetical protein AYL99_00796 [Fonsecaea erecta]OAP64824.1 hypothetical protein AYL99_00796 [Fonsecaea erecta]
MVAMKRSALALAMAAVVGAQSSSVINVFIPDADDQTLLGSLIASDATKTTMAISCPSNADMSECGFGPDAVTITFGPSTFRAAETLDPLSLMLDCNVKGTTAATCTETYIGPADILDTETATATDSITDTDTKMITTTTTTVLSQSEIVFIPVTITAFADSSSNTSATTTGASGSTASLATATSTGSGSSSSASSSASASTSPLDQSNSAGSVGATRWELVSAAGAGLIGLTLVLL